MSQKTVQLLGDFASGTVRRGAGSGSFSRTKAMSPTRSTRQQAIGSSAGARNASPVRTLKQAQTALQLADILAYDMPLVVGIREQGIAAPQQDRVLGIDTSEHHAAVRKTEQRKPVSKIRGSNAFFFRHDSSKSDDLAPALRGAPYDKATDAARRANSAVHRAPLHLPVSKIFSL